MLMTESKWWWPIHHHYVTNISFVTRSCRQHQCYNRLPWMKSIVLKTVDTIIDMNRLQCIKFLVLLIFRSISKMTVAINNAILDNEAPTMFIILKILNNSMLTFSVSAILTDKILDQKLLLPVEFLFEHIAWKHLQN